MLDEIEHFFIAHFSGLYMLFIILYSLNQALATIKQNDKKENFMYPHSSLDRFKEIPSPSEIQLQI